MDRRVASVAELQLCNSLTLGGKAAGLPPAESIPCPCGCALSRAPACRRPQTLAASSRLRTRPQPLLSLAAACLRITMICWCQLYIGLAWSWKRTSKCSNAALHRPHLLLGPLPSLQRQQALLLRGRQRAVRRCCCVADRQMRSPLHQHDSLQQYYAELTCFQASMTVPCAAVMAGCSLIQTRSSERLRRPCIRVHAANAPALAASQAPQIERVGMRGGVVNPACSSSVLIAS